MILDGKKLRDELLVSYKEKINKDNLSITLAIILVGDDEASKLYIKNKEKYCSMVGINVIKYLLPKETSEEELMTLIKKLNEKEGKTIIMVTHDVMVGSFASRLLYIQDGTIKEQLSRKEFKTQEDYFYNISKINSKEQLISLKK